MTDSFAGAQQTLLHRFPQHKNNTICMFELWVRLELGWLGFWSVSRPTFHPAWGRVPRCEGHGSDLNLRVRACAQSAGRHRFCIISISKRRCQLSEHSVLLHMLFISPGHVGSTHRPSAHDITSHWGGSWSCLIFLWGIFFFFSPPASFLQGITRDPENVSSFIRGASSVRLFRTDLELLLLYVY